MSTATYSGEELVVTFSGRIEDHQEGAILVDLEVTEITLLGHALDFATLSEPLQASILALADDLEFDNDEPNYEDGFTSDED